MAILCSAAFLTAGVGLWVNSVFGSLRGITTRVCSTNDQDAKAQIATQIQSDPLLCNRVGPPAAQVGGWKCRTAGKPTRSCPSGYIRCNTQYYCEVGPDENPAAEAAPGAPGVPGAAPAEAPRAPAAMEGGGTPVGAPPGGMEIPNEMAPAEAAAPPVEQAPPPEQAAPPPAPEQAAPPPAPAQ